MAPVETAPEGLDTIFGLPDWVLCPPYATPCDLDIRHTGESLARSDNREGRQLRARYWLITGY